jgi:hypothetical protein
MRRREGGGEAIVRGEEAVVTADEKMGEAEGGRGRRRARRRSASGGRGRPWTTAPTTPSRWGNCHSISPGAGTICPGGPRGKERTTVKVGAKGRRSGGGEGFRPPLTVETTRWTPHPLRRRRCCRRRCRRRHHPPSRRRTSREGCRRPSTPTSTPSPLPRGRR